MTSGDHRARERAARGLLLGLVPGDAVGAVGGHVPPGASLLRNTVAGQLACFTTEGLIRASVRFGNKGICHPPTVVWHAMARWGHGQGIPADALYENWRSGAARGWPNGWIAEVPALRERRGSAPATVAALRSGVQGNREEPATGSAGFHGMVRTLPVGLLGSDPPAMADLAADVAALTHGSPDGYLPAAHGALVVAGLAACDDIASGLDDVLLRTAEVESAAVERCSAAVAEGRRVPGDRDVLLRHSPDRTATSALAGALCVAASFPERSRVADAVLFAAQVPGAGTAATTGALLGAVHGPDALPVGVLSRAELAWVADVLARDLVEELTESPGGHERLVETGPGALSFAWQDGSHPDWQHRYPGW